MAKLVENVYGEALFELAVEEDKVQAYEEEARMLLTVLEENPDFLQMMNHPNIDKEEKLKTAETVFSGRISDELLGLIRMVIEKNHVSQMEAILEHYIRRAMAYRNIGIAEVTTPLALSESKKKEVEERLLQTTPFVSFEMRYEVDPSLLGGMVIRIGDRVVDSSVKHKLEMLTRNLSKVQIKAGESTP